MYTQLNQSHDQHQLMHDAIKDVIHDAACRCHPSSYRDRLEGALHQVCQEVTKAAKHSREREQEPDRTT